MDFTGMKVWITGGAGFLGQRLTKELRDSGAEVTSISRRKSPVASRSFQLNLAGDADLLKSLVAEHGSPDVLIHAASKQPGSGTFGEFVKSNVLTAANLVDTFRDSPPRQIIYTSTLSVYARPSTLPVSEHHPPVFPSPYSATKRWPSSCLRL
jgi:nucleoside-diphosphate-sugar epimerase